MKPRLRFVRLSLALFSSALALVTVCVIPAAHGAVTRSIALGGTSSPQTGSFTPSGTSDATNVEYPGAARRRCRRTWSLSGNHHQSKSFEGRREGLVGEQQQESQVESRVRDRL